MNLILGPAQNWTILLPIDCLTDIPALSLQPP